MADPEETYKILSEAVRELRIASRAAKLMAVENEKLPPAEREAGRNEYVQVLLQLQTTAQAVLDSVDDPDDKPIRTRDYRLIAR
ncbi:MAG: hypothetical protein ABI771_17010 [Betaproteobacteria bacterium]